MSKSAIVYFSQTNNTEKIAEEIANITESPIFKIEAKTPYSDDDINWRDMNSRANREQNDASARPEIANIPDISEFDTIYLGYPIWWGTIPKIINTLIDTKILNSKKIAAFCTSGSSSIDASISALKEYGLDIIGNQRFGTSAAEGEIKEWVNNL